MSADPTAHYQLQMATLTTNLRQAETELAEWKRRAERIRQGVLDLGQATVPEALAAIPSADQAAGLFAPPVKMMDTEAVVRLLQAALPDKIRKLTAFGVGITEEQRNRFLARILETDVQDWVNDPGMMEAVRKYEDATRRAEDAEAKARHLQAQLDANGVAASQQSARVFALEREVNELRQQRTELLTVRPVPVPAPTTAAKTQVVSIPSEPAPIQEPKKYEKGVDDSFPVLVMILATRGYCERPRLAEILTAPEFELSADPNNFLINGAFDQANALGLIEQVTARNETGVGRAPNLVRLTEAGRTYARTTLHVEPVPSELNRLLKLHDTLEHVALILATRRLFIEKYPVPVSNVDLFPDPILLADGKRSEPDLVVTLGSGKVMLIECERPSPKDPVKRADKWHKCWVAGHGEIYVVCPDKQTTSALSQEISVWYANHGDRLRARVTSVYQVMSAKEISTEKDFWAWSRDF